MASATLHNYIRSHRRKAGLSQIELGRLLGHRNDVPVSRHELSRATPTLLTALAYEAVFRVPVAELFPGAMNAVRLSVEDRIRAFKKELENSALRGRKAIPIAQKLVWTSERELGE